MELKNLQNNFKDLATLNPRKRFHFLRASFIAPPFLFKYKEIFL